MASQKEYRSLYAGLVDHPKFLPLSPDAKLVFFMAKLQLGASGIGVLYPGTIASQIGGSWDADRVTDSLSELAQGEDRAWVEIEANVVWIRKGLENEPHLSMKRETHRASISSHLANLPKLAIVNRFAAYYELPIPHPEVGVTDRVTPTLAATGRAVEREITHNPTSVVEQQPKRTGGVSLMRKDDDPTERWLANPKVRAEFEDRLRKFVWLGDAPPALFVGHTADNDWEIFCKLAREYGVEEVLGAMHYFRKAIGYLDACTMRLFMQRGRRDLINDAIHTWRKAQTVNNRNEFERTLGDLFRGVADAA